MRSVPLVHCLLWLNKASKLRKQEYDKFVQAEIPDQNKDPENHELGLKHMIHDPNCSNNSPCWKDGTWSKRYPKPFNVHALYGEDSYPVYRRRSPGMGGFEGHQE